MTDNTADAVVPGSRSREICRFRSRITGANLVIKMTDNRLESS